MVKKQPKTKKWVKYTIVFLQKNSDSKHLCGCAVTAKSDQEARKIFKEWVLWHSDREFRILKLLKKVTTHTELG